MKVEIVAIRVEMYRIERFDCDSTTSVLLGDSVACQNHGKMLSRKSRKSRCVHKLQRRYDRGPGEHEGRGQSAPRKNFEANENARTVPGMLRISLLMYLSVAFLLLDESL